MHIASYPHMLSSTSCHHSIANHSCIQKCPCTFLLSLAEEYDVGTARVTDQYVVQLRPRIAFPIGLIGVPYLYFNIVYVIKIEFLIKYKSRGCILFGVTSHKIL